MATRPTLPYFAPADTLPAPLPTVAEIIAGGLGRSGGVEMPHKSLAYFRPHFVVKYGSKGRILQEGENMLFVRQSTNVPVPTVYALFHDEESGGNFIIQECIEGRGLTYVWRKLHNDQSGKEAIISQLRQHFNELRSLPSPGYFGGVWRQPILEHHMSGRQFCEDLPPALPCETAEEWVDRMIPMRSDARPHPHPARFAWMKRMVRGSFRGQTPVFTHGDLDRSNILVRPDKTLVLIDWEYSGWHPACWEYCFLRLTDPFEGDWSEYVPQFLGEEWPNQMGWMLCWHEWYYSRFT